MKRKSPYRHHVKAHRRKERPVHSYDRGKGKKPYQSANPNIRRQHQQQGEYNIKIEYTTSSEQFNVTASTYPEAIQIGLISRTNLTPPKLVEATRK